MKEKNKVPLIYSRKEHIVCFMNYKRQVYLSKEENFDIHAFDTSKFCLAETTTNNGHYVIYSPLMTIINDDALKDIVCRSINPTEKFIKVTYSYNYGVNNS